MGPTLTETGIGWQDASGSWTRHHEWRDLIRVYGYKQDLMYYDELWIGFLFADGSSFEIGEGDPLHMTALDAASGHYGIEAGTWYLGTLNIPAFDASHYTLWQNPATDSA
jgi:hypothetical protein